MLKIPILILLKKQEEVSILNVGVLIASIVFYIASIVLLVMFCFKEDADLLWLIGIAVFVFGAILNDDNLIAAFFAVIISAVMLIIFSMRQKDDVIHNIATIFGLLGVIFSDMLNNDIAAIILSLVIVSMIAYMIVNRRFLQRGSRHK